MAIMAIAKTDYQVKLLPTTHNNLASMVASRYRLYGVNLASSEINELST